jgi:DNA topoisomerase-3
MISVLHVAEKPSVAQAIAHALAQGRPVHSEQSAPCPTHELEGTWPPPGQQGQQAQPPVLPQRARFRVTSVVGHVYSTDFEGSGGSDVGDWARVDPLALLSGAVRVCKVAERASVVAHLRRVARGVHVVVLWLDCDREGEAICFEVLAAVAGCPVPGAAVLRARFSAVTAHDVRAALGSLGVPNECEARAVDARQELDLRIGVAFTRFQTLYFRERYASVSAAAAADGGGSGHRGRGGCMGPSALISFGPCQTPTLGFCVSRHDEIARFVPQPFWHVVATLGCGGVQVRAEWRRGRVFDRAAAADAFHQLQRHAGKAGAAVVQSVRNIRLKKGRPLPLNTVELLKAASRQLRMGPAHTMRVAEGLYTAGHISYPRTESSRYPASFDVAEAVGQHCGHPVWGGYARALLALGVSASSAPGQDGGVDMGDHPPITPTASVSEAQLSGDAWRLYEHISRHFLATVSPDCEIVRTEADVLIGGEAFEAVGQRVTSGGWTNVMPWHQPRSDECGGGDNNLAGFQGMSGKTVEVARVENVEGKTTAPEHLSEAELVGLMERHGIGTDASIPVHINNVIERGYCRVDASTRTITPTALGVALVHGYMRIDPELVLPAVRANIEQSINQIAKGQVDSKTVVERTLAQFVDKYKHFVANIGLMDELFCEVFPRPGMTSTITSSSSTSTSSTTTTITEAAAEGKLMTRCKCKRLMTLIEPKSVATGMTRLHCSKCQETHDMPQGGVIRQFNGDTCPLCGFELVTFGTGGAGRTGRAQVVCPSCWSVPVLEGVEAHTGCSGCPHATCAYSWRQRGLARCPECDTGMLCVDPGTAPGHSRVSCGGCPYVVSFPRSFRSVSVAVGTVCGQCGATLADITFKSAAQCPLPVKTASITACIVCDPFVVPLTLEAHADMHGDGRSNKRCRGGRGRKRGRGR